VSTESTATIATEQRRLDGEARARVVIEYMLANPGVVDIKTFYAVNVAAWFKKKRTACVQPAPAVRTKSFMPAGFDLPTLRKR
jgi:hypothetical protein